MTEDYLTSAFQVHESILVAIMLFTIFGAVPLWGLLMCFRRLRLSLRTHVAQAVTYGIGWLLILVAGKLDPTTFTEWFLD